MKKHYHSTRHPFISLVWAFCLLMLPFFSQAQTTNWRLQPLLTADSYGEVSLKNALSSGTALSQPAVLQPGTTRTLTFKLPATPKGGMLVFTPANNISELQVSTFQSTDGKNWTLLTDNAYLDGKNGNLQKADVPKTTVQTWFKVDFNNKSTAAIPLKEAGLYDFGATNGTSKNPYFILLGASITVSSGGSAEWLATLKARVGNYDAVFFNLAVGGDNTNGLYNKIDGFLAQHPNAGYALLEIGGNDVSAQRVMTFADYKGSYIQNMDAQIRAIISKIYNAGKDLAVARISFRNYGDQTNYMGKFQPSVIGGKIQENGSLPYNFILDKIIKETNPVFWNQAERRGVIDFYQYTLNNQQWLVAGDGVHFYGSDAYHVRDFWADYALKYFFTGQRSPVIPYTEFVAGLTATATQAVVKAESSRTELDVFNARILVEQLNSTATRIPLLDRLDAITGNVTPPAALAFTVSKTDITACFGDATGTITITASGGTAPYQFAINNGSYSANNGIFNNLGAGNYNITIKDNAGQTAVVPAIALSQPAQLTAALKSKTDLACYGSNDGQLAIDVAGGTSPYQYALNNGAFVANGGIFQNLPAGNYDMKVKDGKGCITSLATVVLVQPGQLTLSLKGKTDINCYGNTDGQISVSATGGTAPFQFSLNNGTFQANGGIFNNLPAGNYDIKVKDSKGCTASLPTVALVQPAQLSISLKSKVDLTCNGSNDGQLSVNITGGTAPYQFSVNNGTYTAGNGIFQNLPAGTYAVQVKDSKGCAGQLPAVTLSQPAVLVAALTSRADAGCAGTDGSFTVGVSGGTLPYQFSLNNAPFVSGNGTFQNLAPGTYNLRIKDNNGCAVSLPAVVISQPLPLTASVSGIRDVSCASGNDGGFTINVSGGVPPYTYTVKNNPASVSGVFTMKTAGLYEVTVRDSQGCTFVLPAFEIKEPKPLSSTVIKTDVTCNGKDGNFSISIVGGTAPYLASVNGGAYLSDVFYKDLPAGKYDYSVKDSKGCTTSGSVTLQGGSPLLATIVASTNVSCYGGTNGSITLQASGGMPPYQYAVNGGDYLPHDNYFTGLVSGIYKIVVKDSKGCTAAFPEITLSQPSQMQLILKSQTGVSCKGNNDGQVTLQASGGAGTYQYAIDDPHATGNNGTFTGITPGSHLVSVIDSQGCSASLQITIAEPATLALVFKGKNDVVCFGSNEGQIAINASGGTPDYHYFINDQEVVLYNNTFTNLAAGTYRIVLKDSRGCTATLDPIAISQPAGSLSLALTGKKDIVCFGSNDGQISVSASGGTPGYLYYLDKQETGNNTGNFSRVSSGNHTLTAKDSKGCWQQITVVINENPQLLLALGDTTHPTKHDSSDGILTVMASGGGGNYVFSLNGGNFVANNGKFTGLTAGTYTITVSDGLGCPLPSLTLTLLSPPLPVPPGLSLYPNPSATGFVRITFATSDAQTPCLIQVSDIMGRIYYNKVLDVSQLANGMLLPDNSPLPKGIYILFISQGENTARSRFVVE